MITMMRCNNLFLVLATLATTSGAFLVRPTSHPNLNSFAEAQLGTLLQFQLDLTLGTTTTTTDNKHRLSLQGPELELLSTKARGVLPVANGWYPQLSSGSRGLEFRTAASVIDFQGQCSIECENGSWEMTWKEGQRTGSLVCALDLPQPVTRNQVTLPAGRVYVDFTLWTQDGWMEDVAYKQLQEQMIQKYEHDKLEAQTAFVQTSNPLAKMAQYHKILQAMEGVQNTPPVTHIPDSSKDTMPWNHGLIVHKQGTVWTKRGGGKVVKLGVATLTTLDPKKQQTKDATETNEAVVLEHQHQAE